MVDLIVKRYAKALVDGKNEAELEAKIKELSSISGAFGSDKFLSIVNSVEVSNDKKVELILSFLENGSKDTINLIKLLGENRRLNIIPALLEEVRKELFVMKNSYEGTIYAKEQLDSTYVTSLEQEFGKKFDIKLKLNQKVCDYDGIKVDIEGLGVEIGFSKDRLKSQMINHILKAV
ncbi:F0F1 ATP synthase subunit delta [Arcobacter sp. FWKO B]|uniref:F0F1 ATP synthase subunit delta n=1 Tax=Arcobacter sp. FWKO B TaxID=2593672 RepID=UPI0018A5FADA|nr:F0F1 ATP synthase subunit delta [Arcobacter sp. FWKO B]QOG11764.1 F0F1 ATP synthase subunit delta [Arcobacter sp. FWKO B]